MKEISNEELLFYTDKGYSVMSMTASRSQYNMVKMISNDRYECTIGLSVSINELGEIWAEFSHALKMFYSLVSGKFQHKHPDFDRMEAVFTKYIWACEQINPFANIDNIILLNKQYM